MTGSSPDGWDPLLTPAEVAARLRIKPDTLQKMRRYGRGPRYVMIGSKTPRYKQSEVQAYVDARTVENTTQADALQRRH